MVPHIDSFVSHSFVWLLALGKVVSPVIAGLQGQLWQNHVEGLTCQSWPLYCGLIWIFPELSFLSSFCGLLSTAMALRFSTWEGKISSELYCKFDLMLPFPGWFTCFLCFQEEKRKKKKNEKKGKEVKKGKSQMPWYEGRADILQEGTYHP